MATKAAGRQKLVLSDGRYTTERVIGHGGMATVYLGLDESLERPVAIKLLADNLANDDDFRNRFQLEARLAGRLTHPNVVQVFDVSEIDGRPFIVMEYVAGQTLSELLGKRGPLAEDEALELALQACAGLEHAHRAKLVHRDIKPQNLLVAEDGTVKIADFGIARAAEDKGLTQTGAVLGTRPYLSPERERGEQAGPQADVYALGVVIAEMVGGRAGPRLVKIVSRCLEEDPGKRYDSAVGLRRALAGLTQNRKGRPAIAGLVHRAGTAARGLVPGGGEAETSRMDPTEVSSPTRTVHLEPIRRRRFSRLSSVRRRVAAVAAVLALAAGGALVALGADGGGAAKDAEAEKPAAGASKPDLTGEPADDARALADWVRRQAETAP